MIDYLYKGLVENSIAPFDRKKMIADAVSYNRSSEYKITKSKEIVGKANGLNVVYGIFFLVLYFSN